MLFLPVWSFVPLFLGLPSWLTNSIFTHYKLKSLVNCSPLAGLVPRPAWCPSSTVLLCTSLSEIGIWYILCLQFGFANIDHTSLTSWKHFRNIGILSVIRILSGFVSDAKFQRWKKKRTVQWLMIHGTTVHGTMVQRAVSRPYLSHPSFNYGHRCSIVSECDYYKWSDNRNELINCLLRLA